MSVDLSLFTVRSFLGVVRGHLPKNTYKCVTPITAAERATQTNLHYISASKPEAITFIRPIQHNSIKGVPVTLTEIIPMTRVPNQEKLHVADLGFPVITPSTVVENADVKLADEDLLELWREVTVDYSTTPEFVVRDSAKRTKIAALLDNPLPMPNSWKESGALAILKENKPTWSAAFAKNFTNENHVDLRATKP